MTPLPVLAQAAVDALGRAPPDRPAPEAAPLPGPAATDLLLTLATARPWRRSGVDADTRDDTRAKLADAVAAGRPIEFSVPFGGYKGFRQPAFPGVDWAEVVWLDYLRSYASRLAAVHAPGVIVSLSYFFGVLDFINGLATADQQRYLDELDILCADLSGEGVRIRLVDLTPACGGVAATRAEIDRRAAALRATADLPVADGSLRSAARNLIGPDLPDAAAAREAALRCAAMEGLEPRRAFNKFSTRIQITHIRGASRALHLGTCQTSIMQPWVGTGILEPDGAGGLRPRILNADQRPDLVRVPVRHRLAGALAGLRTIPIRHD